MPIAGHFVLAAINIYSIGFNIVNCRWLDFRAFEMIFSGAH